MEIHAQQTPLTAGPKQIENGVHYSPYINASGTPPQVSLPGLSNPPTPIAPPSNPLRSKIWLFVASLRLSMPGNTYIQLREPTEPWREVARVLVQILLRVCFCPGKKALQILGGEDRCPKFRSGGCFSGQWFEVERMCCNFVVEPKVGVDDRHFSSSPRTDRE